MFEGTLCPPLLQGMGALSGIASGARRATSEVEIEARHRFQATLEVRKGGAERKN